MIQQFWQMAIPCLCTLCMTFSVPLVAEEEQQTTQAQTEQTEQTDQMRPVIAGERALPVDEMITIENKRFEVSEDESSEHVSKFASSVTATTMIGRNTVSLPMSSLASYKSAANQFVFTTHPSANHYVNEYSLFYNKAYLDDGSAWNIDYDDRYVISTWYSFDPIWITPSGDYFYPYWLTNQNTGSAVRASLSAVYPNYLTYQITYIDHYYNEIWLNDGSKWETALSDNGINYKMLIGDTVIIGVNNGSLSSMFPNVLINANINSYSRSICTFHY